MKTKDRDRVAQMPAASEFPEPIEPSPEQWAGALEVLDLTIAAYILDHPGMLVSNLKAIDVAHWLRMKVKREGVNG